MHNKLGKFNAQPWFPESHFISKSDDNWVTELAAHFSFRQPKNMNCIDKTTFGSQAADKTNVHELHNFPFDGCTKQLVVRSCRKKGDVYYIVTNGKIKLRSYNDVCNYLVFVYEMIRP